MAVFGPLRVADEVDHWLAAYWYSNILTGTDDPGHMLLRSEDVAIIELDADRKGDEAHLLADLAGATGDSSMVDVVSWRGFTVLNRPFWVELAPALGITLGRLMGLGAFATYYLGRICNFAVYVVLASLTVKRAPIGKAFFAMAFLLPMSLSLGASYSWDGPIIALSLLLTALCLRVVVRDGDDAVGGGDLAAILVVGLLLAPLKLFYSFLALLVLLVPDGSFRSRRQRWLVKLGIPVAVIGFGLLVNCVSITSVLDGTKLSGSAGQYVVFEDRLTFADVLADPARYVALFANTVIANAGSYLLLLLGERLGWLNVTPSFGTFIPTVLLIMLVLGALLGDGLRWRATPSARLLIVAVIVAVYSGFHFAQLVGWTVKGAETIQGVQGRYFIPILGLAVPLVHGLRSTIASALTRPVLMAFLAVDAVFVLDVAQVVLRGL